jgi:hypothetical protein
MTLAFWLAGTIAAYGTYNLVGRMRGRWDLPTELAAMFACLAVWLLFVIAVPPGPVRLPDLSWHPAMQPGVWG